MSANWLTELDEAVRSRAAGAVLTFNTSDRVFVDGDEGARGCFLRYALAERFYRRGYRVGYYSSGSGFRELVPPDMDRDPADPSPFREVPVESQAEPPTVLSAVGEALRESEGSPPQLIILDYADHLAPDSADMTAMLRPDQAETLEIVHGWGQDDRIRPTRSIVVLISYENAVSSLLTESGSFRRLRVDLPGREEREAFTRFLIRAREEGEEEEVGSLANDYSVARFSRGAGGLRLTDIEELFRQSAAVGSPITPRQVEGRKEAAIQQIGRDLVEVVEPEEGFEGVAGLEHAKRYFRRIQEPWREGAPNVPQAMLLAGVPGCGKSHLVKAVGHEFEVPLLVMRNVRERWVGASERNLETVLWIAENLSPCILWTDEVDQAVGQRGTGASTDSGTSERLLARIFEFFGSSDHRGEVLWLATTNRPDLLDAALLDRFQLVLPFIHPSRMERAELLELLTAQIGCTLGEDLDPDRVAARPELRALTARSLQEILANASLRADASAGGPGSSIEIEHLEAAVDDYQSTYNPVETELMALLALQMASFGSLMPWRTADVPNRNGDRERWLEEWPDYLERIVEPTTGELRPRELADRIGELKRRRRRERRLQ